MDTTLKFDEVVLVKKLDDKFKKLGEHYQIANILENSFLLRDAKTKVALGVVSFSDFEEHFVRAEKFKGWTKWQQFNGLDGQNDCMYRTNGRRVQVKFITNKVRSEACCHSEDEFDLSFGLQIAYLRCFNKVLAKQKEEYKEKLAMINGELAENKGLIRKMLDSLNA